VVVEQQGEDIEKRHDISSEERERKDVRLRTHACSRLPISIRNAGDYGIKWLALHCRRVRTRS